MKNWITFVLALVSVLAFSGCGKRDTFKIGITIPSNTTEEAVSPEDFSYSYEEISPKGNQITMSSGEGLGDTEVICKPIEEKEKNAYEPTYLPPGMPVKMNLEKGAWFKIGVSMQNYTDTDKTVFVIVKGVEVRIE